MESSDIVINKEPDGHYYWLDLIRFLAAFAVMACHFRGAFFVEYSTLSFQQQNPIIFAFYFITRLGFEAVLVFFVLSGFLVGGRAIQRITYGTFKVKSFVVDRAVRIMLPLVASLILFLTISLYFHLPINISDWIGSLLSLQGIITGGAFDTLWSLSYEVWFYILTCGICIMITKRQLKTSVKYNVGILLTILALLVFTKLNTAYLFTWIIGACAVGRLPQKNNFIMFCTAFLSLTVIIMLQLGSGSHFMPKGFLSGDIYKNVLSVLFGLTFTIFLQQVIQSPGGNISLFINKIGSKAAAFSYTLYLTHIPVLKMLKEMGAPRASTINACSRTLFIMDVNRDCDCLHFILYF